MNTEFLQGGMSLRHSAGLFAMSTDSVLLADFAADGHGKRICDLCAGSGNVGLLVLSREPSSCLTAVELREKAAELLSRNIAENGLSDRARSVCADIRAIREVLPAASFDRVTCNPPYFPVGSGRAPKTEDAAVSRTEQCCTVPDFCAAAAYLLKTGGVFYLVHRTQRLTDVLCALRASGLEPKLLRFVRHRPGADAELFLLRSVSGGKPGLRLAEDLVLADENGVPTGEYRKIYRMEEP